jgi:hypothetical protein
MKDEELADLPFRWEKHKQDDGDYFACGCYVIRHPRPFGRNKTHWHLSLYDPVTKKHNKHVATYQRLSDAKQAAIELLTQKESD